MFCTNCGSQVVDGANFCPMCGTKLNVTVAAAPVVQQTVTAQPTVVYTPAATTNYIPADYQIILLDIGTCTKTAARDIFEELLGYSVSQARKLSDNTPIQLAQNLTQEQALYIAQLLCEYGMQVTVCNNHGYIDIDGYATQSVFTKQGTLYQKVLKVFETLGALNRMTSFDRWNSYDPRRVNVFHPRYVHSAPPAYTRKTPRKDDMPDPHFPGPGHDPRGGMPKNPVLSKQPVVKSQPASRTTPKTPTRQSNTRTEPGRGGHKGPGPMGGPGGPMGGPGGRW